MKKLGPALALASASVLVLLLPSGTATAGRKPPAPSDACGTLQPKATGGSWTCTFVDNFDGSALTRAKWEPQIWFATGVQATHACYLDDPSVVSVSNGALKLTVRKVATPVSCSFGGMSGPTNYVAGSVATTYRFGQQYGRFEARTKTTASTVRGLHEAFWLWPDNRFPSSTPWPEAGEIDISETYSVHPTLSIPFLHYSADVNGEQNGVNTAWGCTANRGVWNTYRLDWTATRLEIKVNGTTCLVNTSGDPAFQKPYTIALTQGLGGLGNVYDGRAPLPATMSVDYVKVWK